jgi:hypothetical protein
MMDSTRSGGPLHVLDAIGQVGIRKGVHSEAQSAERYGSSAKCSADQNKTTQKKEKRDKAETDRGKQGAEPEPCGYHRPILEVKMIQAWREMSPMKRFILEDPSERYAFYIDPDTGQASTNKGCTCEDFVGDILEISEDEEEWT